MGLFDINFDKAANQRKAIAVEFHQKAIRLLQFRKSGKGYTIQSFLEVDLDQDAIQQGVVSDPKSAGNQIAKLLGKSQPSAPDTSYVICIVPQVHLFFMNLEIPNVPQTEIANVLENRVTEVIPMDSDQVYWDWRVIGNKGNKLKVQLAAVPKEIVDSYMDTLREARLIPLLFESSAEAASRVGRVEDKGGSLLLIEIRETRAVISIAREQNILFSTDVPLDFAPGEHVNARVLLNKIDELIEYTRRSDADAASANEPAEVRLYGNPELVSAVLESIKQMGSAHNISRIRYQSSTNDSLTNILPADDLDDYVPLIGSAIRGLVNYSQEEVTLNLVPDVAKQAFKSRETAGILRRYMALLALDAALITIGFFLVLMQTDLRVDSLQQQYDAVRSITTSPRITNLETSIADLNQESQSVVSIANQIYEWEDILDAINGQVPRSIELLNITMIPDPNSSNPNSPYRLSIEGRSQDRLATIDLVNRLRSDGLFTAVKLPLASLEEEENLFSIEASIEQEALQKGNEAR